MKKKSKRVRPHVQSSQLPKKGAGEGKGPLEKPKSPVVEGTTSVVEETSIEVIGDGGKSSSAPKKGKGKEATSDVVMTVASENVKIHRPKFLYKGQPLLAK